MCHTQRTTLSESYVIWKWYKLWSFDFRDYKEFWCYSWSTSLDARGSKSSKYSDYGFFVKPRSQCPQIATRIASFDSLTYTRLFLPSICISRSNPSCSSDIFDRNSVCSLTSMGEEYPRIYCPSTKYMREWSQVPESVSSPFRWGETPIAFKDIKVKALILLLQYTT